MQVEMLPATDNVIRFPVEMREKPSMRLLFQLRPDARILFMQAEGLGFELPQHGLGDCTDQATAEHIAGTAGRQVSSWTRCWSLCWNVPFTRHGRPSWPQRPRRRRGVARKAPMRPTP
jgi:hypothetical protein